MDWIIHRVWYDLLITVNIVWYVLFTTVNIDEDVYYFQNFWKITTRCNTTTWYMFSGLSWCIRSCAQEPLIEVRWSEPHSIEDVRNQTVRIISSSRFLPTDCCSTNGSTILSRWSDKITPIMVKTFHWSHRWSWLVRMLTYVSIRTMCADLSRSIFFYYMWGPRWSAMIRGLKSHRSQIFLKNGRIKLKSSFTDLFQHSSDQTPICANTPRFGPPIEPTCDRR